MQEGPYILIKGRDDKTSCKLPCISKKHCDHKNDMNTTITTLNTIFWCSRQQHLTIGDTDFDIYP